MEWERCGPAQQRRYWRVAERWLAQEADAEAPHAVRGLARLLGAAAWLRLLADYTDLPLASLRRLELQRWAPGDFTVCGPTPFYSN